MPFTAFSRMKDEIAVGFIVAVVLTFIFAYIPNYQKYYYQNTETKAYDKYKDYAGYPAAEGFPVVESLADIKNAKGHNFTITVDVSDLTPVDLYMCIVDRKLVSNGFGRMLNNNDFGGIGRYFKVELASGEQVLVFLDDTTIGLPKEGEATLPIGIYKPGKEGDFLNILRERSGLPDIEGYVDMAGEWRSGKEAEKSEQLRFLIGISIFVGSWIISSKFFFKLTSRRQKKG